MIKIIKGFIKKVVSLIGLDIVRISKSPSTTLFGLSNLPIRTIIDVGANTGQFAKYITTLFPKSQVYCFEPLPEPFKKLNQWAVGQKDRKVMTFNFALGNDEGVLEMYRHVQHSPSSSFLEATKLCEDLYPLIKSKVSIPVKQTTLDRWVGSLQNPLIPEILIKIDVQGYEDRVISGGKEIFGLAKACIVEVNLDLLYKNQAAFKEISSLLYSFGYHYAGNLNQIYANDGHVICIDAVFVK